MTFSSDTFNNFSTMHFNSPRRFSADTSRSFKSNSPVGFLVNTQCCHSLIHTPEQHRDYSVDASDNNTFWSNTTSSYMSNQVNSNFIENLKDSDRRTNVYSLMYNTEDSCENYVNVFPNIYTPNSTIHSQMSHQVVSSNAVCIIHLSGPATRFQYWGGTFF